MKIQKSRKIHKRERSLPTVSEKNCKFLRYNLSPGIESAAENSSHVAKEGRIISDIFLKI